MLATESEEGVAHIRICPSLDALLFVLAPNTCDGNDDDDDGDAKRDDTSVTNNTFITTANRKHTARCGRVVCLRSSDCFAIRVAIRVDVPFPQ